MGLQLVTSLLPPAFLYDLARQHRAGTEGWPARLEEIALLRALQWAAALTG